LKDVIVVRGGGDLATGVVQKFFRAGFSVVILETHAPTAIRRSVSLCEAVYENVSKVEDMTCLKINSADECEKLWSDRVVPLLIDPNGETISKIKPTAVIDAIVAKRNVGTNMEMAAITIGLGPGFRAGKDVHAVIETMRGHNLGRLVLHGEALPDTGIPGDIDGKSSERVLRAPKDGILNCFKQIGDTVEQGEIIFVVDGQSVCAPFAGLVRGILRDGTQVKKSMKTADLDPRIDIDINTISDKARAIGGAVLEAYFYLRAVDCASEHEHRNRPRVQGASVNTGTVPAFR
jgi:xanthine dehydrogenase accessory factor